MRSYRDVAPVLGESLYMVEQPFQVDVAGITGEKSTL